MPSLYDFAAQLRAFVSGEIARADVERWLGPVLAADPLDVAESDAAPWEDGHDEERLFWRLVYLVESSGEGADDALRADAGRIVACLASTASAADTFELLPMVLDQERFCAIVAKHLRGVISRTGFLSVLAESGYPPHAKLWLEHADAAALRALCDALAAGEYGVVARMIERAPGA
jgi:hypothetical protein